MSGNPVRQFLLRDIFWRDRWVLANAILSGILLLGTWILLFGHVQGSPDVIPLHYTIYFNIDYFGSRELLYALGGWGTMLWIVNFVFARFTFAQARLLSRCFIWMNTFAQLILIWSAWLLATLPTLTVS